MRSRFSIPASLAVISLCASGTASAVPTYCSAGSPHPDGLKLSNVTFRGSNADDCFGVQSGNSVGANASYIGWDGFSLLVSDDADVAGGASNFWEGVDWTLSGAMNAKKGNYTLSWSDPLPVNLPLVLDLVVITKASNRFASYFFDDELFQADPSSGSGTWEITFKNNGGQIPNLSHLDVFARLVSRPPPTTVPEPGTLSLLMLGLAGVGIAARRRRLS